METTDLLEKASKQLARLSLLEEQGQELEERIEEKRHTLEVKERALLVIQQLVENFFEKTLTRTTNLVTFGLKEVFDDRDLALTAEIKERRGKLNIDLITVDDEHGVMGQCRRLFGGAVLQVQHFLLLMILKVLLKSPNFLLLDETFSHVSADYQPNLGKLISDLCKKFNIAVLLVTHNEEILPHADVVYNASLVEGELKLKARFKEDR